MCARSVQDGNLYTDDGKPKQNYASPVRRAERKNTMSQKIERKKQETKKFEGYKDGVKITWRNQNDDSLLALMTVTVSGITVYGCKLFMKKDGTTFVAMPSQKSGDKYYNIVFMTADLLEMINEWSVSAFNSDDGVFEFVPLVKGGK